MEQKNSGYKKTRLLMVLIAVAAFFGACSPYSVLEESVPLTKSLSYNDVYIGWLDYEEDNWKKFGYESQHQWTVVVNEMNVKGLAIWLKEWMAGKNVDHAKKRDYEEPSKGLYVKFSDCVLWDYGAYAEVTLEYIDVSTKETLYKSRIGISAAQGWNFENSLNNLTYNIALYINSQINI